MQSFSSSDIREVFNFYRNSLFAISNDIQFWQSFLDTMIKEYAKSNNEKDRKIYESIFAVYDIPHNSLNGLLKTYKDETFKLSINELLEYRKKFFHWIMNLSILKAYNSSELLLLRSIQLSFFPTLENPLKNRKSADTIHREIKKFLPKADTTNNRHLIQFLKINSQKFDTFSTQVIRIDLKTTWADFFEMISILRNIIAHNSAMVNMDTLNQIKCKSKDIFERHFILIDENGFDFLQPKDGDYFLNFLNLVNDFSLNTAKFIFDQNDLSFLDMS